MLGCCVNYRGDFGGNAYRDGTPGGDQRRPTGDDIPCTCKIYLGMRPGDRWLQHGLEERLRVLYYRLVPARRRVAGKCSFRVSQEVQARQAGGVSDC